MLFLSFEFILSSKQCKIISVGEYSVYVNKDLSGWYTVALSTGKNNFYSSNVLATESSSIVYYPCKIDGIFKEDQVCTALGWFETDEFLDYISDEGERNNYGISNNT